MGKLKEKMLDTACEHCGEVGCFEWEPGYGGFAGSREEPPEDPYPSHWYCEACGEPVEESLWTEDDRGDWLYEAKRDKEMDEAWEREHGK